MEKKKIFNFDSASVKVNFATGILILSFFSSTVYFFFENKSIKQDSVQQIKDLTDKNITLTQNYIDLSKQLSVVQGNTQNITNTMASILNYSPQLLNYRLTVIESKLGIKNPGKN